MYAWQLTLLAHYAVALVAEVVVYESWSCFIVHFFIPDLFYSRVTAAIRTLYQTASMLFDDSRPFPSDTTVLDAPKYWHISAAIAEQHPMLLESAIVKSYHSILPGSSLRAWEHLIPHFEFESWWVVFWTKLRRCFRKVIGGIYCSVPLRCQDAAVHAVLPCIMVFIILYSRNDLMELIVPVSVFSATVMLLGSLCYYDYCHGQYTLAPTSRVSKHKVVPMWIANDDMKAFCPGPASYLNAEEKKGDSIDDMLAVSPGVYHKRQLSISRQPSGVSSYEAELLRELSTPIKFNATTMD